ncbi:calcium-translocating P-type ATPase, SERCA-type [Batrachochytrium salamandrivorans]|nr:calcium-translocating P-type ATPase, SERCA-type [Batrachochytrium salamandrivorans]
MLCSAGQPWFDTGQEVVQKLRSHLATGITDEDAYSRLQLAGRNELPSADPTPFYQLVLKQFQDFLVLILLFAASVSFVLALLETDASQQTTAFVEPFVILTILVINAAVGVVQEQGAERAIDALKQYEAANAIVLRSSHWREIPASELVPGDICSLSTGCKIPADCRLLEIQSTVFALDQSILTGESDTVTKDVDPVERKPGMVVDQAKTNMVFSGTLVTRGKALAVVAFTGSDTAIGKIWKNLEGGGKGSEEESTKHKSPLKQKLDEFGELLSKAIFFICIVVWVINLPNFTDEERGGGSWVKGAIYYFKIAVALAVAAVPEGLPAVVTTCLALGARAMAKEGAIVRCLPAVETLGCTTVIVSDKTGTITTNQMMVERIMLFDNNKVMELEVKGGGRGNEYIPKSSLQRLVHYNHQPLVGNAIPTTLYEVGKVCALCNESKVDYDFHHKRFSFLGEPTEAALRVVVEKIGLPNNSTTTTTTTMVSEEVDVEAFLAKNGSHATVSQILSVASRCSLHWETEAGQLEKVIELTRGNKRKSMSVVYRHALTKHTVLYCKGAAKQVLERCHQMRLSSTGEVILLDNAMRSKIIQQIDRLGGEAYRMLSLATKDLNDSLLSLVGDNEEAFLRLESDMTFVGLVALVDPIRSQVPLAISQCQMAGMRVVICTGDEKQTAEQVARQIGLLKPSLAELGQSISGEEWQSLDDLHKREASQRVAVMYRVEPQHKLDLVRVLRQQNEVVAMTGDGVNDAPALRTADIGLCMGSGTAVAREASDMILLDDNFATIVVAIRQGRSIYQNTKQFIRYLVSSNLGEVACIFFASALGIPEALVPVQLLWVNLVTDGLPATALGFNPVDPLSMQKKPRNKHDPIVDRWSFCRFMVIGFYVGVAVVMGFVWWFTRYENGPLLDFTSQLARYEKCDQEKWQFANGYDCTVFHRTGLVRASTVSLSILVFIEMLNAFNALSEEKSLLDVGLLTNPYLVVAVCLSVSLHLIILYVPMFHSVFGVAPLDWQEWGAVWWFSCPVILIEELLKWCTRRMNKNKGLSSSSGIVEGLKMRMSAAVAVDEKLF